MALFYRRECGWSEGAWRIPVRQEFGIQVWGWQG